jgi:plasmid replication initiation protein
MPRKTKGHTSSNLPQALPSEQRLKKSVGAIHSSGNLTLVQRKLANVLLYSAYDKLLTKRTHTIPVSIMCAMLGWKESNNIDLLKESLLALQQTTIQFNLKEDGHEVWESMSMLSYAHIKNGVCTWRYDEALAEKLFDPAMFAMINLQVQRNIDSAYALNLYENALRYKDTNTGSTGRWELGFFREIVGATNAYYDDFRRLNSKIVKASIEKINEVADIMIGVEYEKQGRSVVALKFFVREKTDEEKKVMQQALSGMSFSESVDAFAEVRNTEAFKALIKHGISERLAFAWIQERGEQGVIDLVAYTEEKDKQNLIKTNTRTYLTHLVKTGAEVGASEYDKEKAKAKQVEVVEAQTEAQKNRLAELEAEFRTIRIKEARNALTLEERNAHARAWLQTEAGQGRDANFDMGKGRFKDSVTNIQFEQVYLTKVVTTPHTQIEFKAWLKETKNLDPVKLGFTS